MLGGKVIISAGGREINALYRYTAAAAAAMIPQPAPVALNPFLCLWTDTPSR